MGLFEQMGIALDPNIRKLKIRKDTWELHHKHNYGDRDEPPSDSFFLDADCEITVDTRNIDGTEFTVEEYLTEYTDNNPKELEQYINADITLMNTVRGSYRKLKDVPVFNGMKIFIHSEQF